MLALCLGTMSAEKMNPEIRVSFFYTSAPCPSTGNPLVPSSNSQSHISDAKVRNPVDSVLFEGGEPVPHAAQDVRDVCHVREHLSEAHHAGVYLELPLGASGYFLLKSRMG